MISFAQASYVKIRKGKIQARKSLELESSTKYEARSMKDEVVGKKKKERMWVPHGRVPHVSRPGDWRHPVLVSSSSLNSSPPSLSPSNTLSLPLS